MNVKIKVTEYYSQTVIEIVDAVTDETLEVDSFSGKWGTPDYQRGWWMAKCDDRGWTVVQ